jgi:hypothetical protein
MRKRLERTTSGAPASSGRFTQITVAFLRDPRLSPEAKVVGALYATYADRDGWAWPGLATLMREAGMGRDSVKRAKKELARAGLLTLQRPRTISGQFARPRYRVSGKVLVRHSTGIQYRGHRVHSTEKPLYG